MAVGVALVLAAAAQLPCPAVPQLDQQALVLAIIVHLWAIFVPVALVLALLATQVRQAPNGAGWFAAILGVSALLALVALSVPTRRALRTQPIEAIGIRE